ncbi:FAD-binding oxidoreductase [Chitinibacter sp. FCG-7]|uniref:FAD-binding oxidoreductase n=1 Tax=Chitinibacter mangrovi TaxID=3153927 RepID=A0AAU7F9D2_9NEIS
MTAFLNDVHSRLNPTQLASIEQPADCAQLQAIIRRARHEQRYISVSGGLHAMGGQQMASGALHLDLRGLNRVLSHDTERGLLQIEAGADWPAIIAATHTMPHPQGGCWAIRQKQTGVDSVTLGGSISANAHGRALLMQPLGDDIEDLTVINAHGELLLCNRQQNAALFALVIGGYGLFGVIYAATLRLSRRQCVKRLVDIIDLDDAINAVFRRADEGCLYGDFQFAIDHSDERFLQRGVFACYQATSSTAPEPSADLPPAAWLKLLKLAHDDKAQAFRLYSQHYLNTDGQQYWADTMQLSTYIPSYAEFLAGERAADAAPESLVIGEHYVPREHLLAFMQQAKGILRRLGVEVVYGTIRAIMRDTVSFLPWAKADFACVIFNLRTQHSQAGLQRTAQAFRELIDASTALDGSFFLTYHRYASAVQVNRAYPQFAQWLQLKKQYDPDELFRSDWYCHYRDEFTRHAAP